MERLPNRYPKISQSHKVPLYKGLSLFYPKLYKLFGTWHRQRIAFFGAMQMFLSVNLCSDKTSVFPVSMQRKRCRKCLFTDF